MHLKIAAACGLAALCWAVSGGRATAPDAPKPAAPPPAAAPSAPAPPAPAPPATAPSPATVSSPAAVGASEKAGASPFEPSELMRQRAAAGGVEPGGTVSPRDPVVLEGVLVRGKEALACFRIGSFHFIVEPGAAVRTNEAACTFVSYEEGAVVLREPGGGTFRVRVGAVLGAGR